MSTPTARIWSRNLLALLVMTLSPAFMQTWAFAHTSLEKYIRQEVSVSMRDGTLDVRLQCVFPSDISLTERRHMDTNGDGVLSSDEKAAYLHDLQERAEKQVRILFNDKVMVLIPLEEPVLDLQDATGVEAHPHEIRLAWFVRVPESFGVGGRIVIESEWWTDRPLMISVRTDVAQGIRLKKTEAKGLRYPKQDEPVCRLLEAQCTAWSPGNVNRERTTR